MKRPRYLIVNGDERNLELLKIDKFFQYDPHLLIEGIICTCWAIQANHAYIYIRGEYKFFIDRLNEAIQEAYKSKIIGDKIMDKYDFKVDITVHRGGGAYICGEKSALIESLEGKRGHQDLNHMEKSVSGFMVILQL